MFANAHDPSASSCSTLSISNFLQGDKDAMHTMLSKGAKLLATTVDENRRRYLYHLSTRCMLLDSQRDSYHLESCLYLLYL